MLGGIATAPRDEDAMAGIAGVVGGTLGVAGPVALVGLGLAGLTSSTTGWGDIAVVGLGVFMFWPVTVTLIGSLGLGVYGAAFATQALLGEPDVMEPPLPARSSVLVPARRPVPSL